MRQPCARQPAGDLAAVLEDIQMPPGEHFGVVVAKHQAAVFGTAHRFPEARRLAYLQADRATLSLEATLDDFPVQTQTQQIMKQFFRCHARRLSTPNFYSTENSEEP